MKPLVAILILLLVATIAGFLVYSHFSEAQEIGRQMQATLAEIQVTSAEIESLELDVLRESCPAKDQVVYADIVRRSGDIQVAVERLEAPELSSQLSGADMENLRQGSLNLTLALQHKKLDCLQRQYKLIGSK